MTTVKHKFFLTFCAVSWFIAGTLIFFAFQVFAEESNTPKTPSASEVQKVPEQGVSQLVLLGDELVERLGALQKETETFFDKSAAEVACGEVSKNMADISSRLKKLKESRRFSYGQTTEIRSAALIEGKTLKKLSDSINQSVLRLEAWTTEWQKEKKRWGELKSTLSKDIPQNVMKPVLAKGQTAIENALNLVTRQLGPLIEAQQKVAEQRSRLGKLTTEIDDLFHSALKDVFRRSVPSMFSYSYYSQLMNPQYYESAGLGELMEPAKEYLSKYGWTFGLQAFAFLLVAHGIRRRKLFLLEEHGRWGFIGERPFAAGLFAAVTFLLWIHPDPVPMTVRIIFLVIICLTTARLIGGLIRDSRIRRIVYSLAVILITIEALKVLEPPLPFFRLFTFFVALGGMFLGGLATLKHVKTGGPPFVIWLVRGGALVFAISFLAELAGYNALAADLIESSLKTGLSLSVCWMVMVLIRGGLGWALHTTRISSVAILRSKADLIIRRSTRVIGFFLGLLLLAANLVIWGVYDSPINALQGFLSLGINLGKWRITLGLVLTAGVILYASLLASWAVQTALTEGLFTVREMQAGARFSIARLIHYAFMLIGCLLALGALGVDLQSITIIGGALGVGIGFGLQSIVNNFVCGLILLFERPVKVGDLVEIDSQWAQIKKIGLRATIVETFDQAELVVPNSEFVNNKVKNWTLTNRASRLAIPVGVAYGSDVAQVLRILRECAEEHPLVMKNRPPMVLFMKFGESSLDFEVRVYAEVDHRLTVQSELLQSIDRRFREAGIEIPFPQRDFHIRSGNLSDIPKKGLSAED